MNRRAFLSSVGLGMFIPLTKAIPLEFTPQSIQSVSLTPDEYQSPLESLNQLMMKYRKVNGQSSQVKVLVFGKRQREDCLNIGWSSSFTREFAMRATDEDIYRASDRYFHDEVRAGRGEFFGYRICWVDEECHFEML